MKKNHAVLLCAVVLCAIVSSFGASATATSLLTDQQRSRFTNPRSDEVQFAQVAPAAQSGQATPANPIGNVATLTGRASVTRNHATTQLELQDPIFKGDLLQTSANSTLGITFDDTTTFNLTANAQIAVDDFVYAPGGSGNAALIDITRGTVAFVAAAVAKTGDMKVTTPAASLGIRGTSVLVEVPGSGGATTATDVAIKLYPDADGKVGHVDIAGRDGAQLGQLSQGASGFAIRSAAGAGFVAVPLQISAQQAARDLGIVHQVHLAQTLGRQIVSRRLKTRRTTPSRTPTRLNDLPKQNGLQKLNNLPPVPRLVTPVVPPPVQIQPPRPTIQIRPSMPR
jgi:hypothetical protein